MGRCVVGGIVGLMDFGYITDSTDHGIIKSNDGNFVGGIAGKSNGTINESYTKSQLTGEDYVGGIAGYGKDIYKTYSLIQIEDANEFVGSIAGEVSEDGKLKENYFVHEKLAGVNGISYKEIAEPISYEELIELDHIPSLFTNFKLNFVIDDEEITTISFDYGESISEDQLPNFSPKEGYYGEWDKNNFSNLKFDEIITGEYKKYITTLSSKEIRENERPIILVDGKFTTDSTLSIDKKNFEDQVDEDSLIEGWQVSVTDNKQNLIKVHYLPPIDEEKNVNIYVHKAGKWEKIKYQESGSYLLFDLDKNEKEFVVVSTKMNRTKIILIILLTLIIVGIFYFFLRKK